MSLLLNFLFYVGFNNEVVKYKNQQIVERDYFTTSFYELLISFDPNLTQTNIFTLKLNSKTNQPRS